jgi:glutaredoxin 3
MASVLMYCTHICPYCIRAEKLLQKKGVGQIEKVNIDENPTALHTMIQLTGRRTVPQIFIGDVYVGGYDNLVDLDMNGDLEPLLQK